MTCREFVAFIMDYLAGALSVSERQDFEEHLAECEDCVAYLQNYQTTVALGKAAFPASDEPLPADVPEQLVQAILAARRHQHCT